MTEREARSLYVEKMVSFIGVNEADGSHKSVLDIYNNHVPLARGYKVKPTDAWCATGVSAAAIAVGFFDIIPTECGCEKQIQLFKSIHRWVEDGANYIPKCGDIIYYNWNDSTQPNDGQSDHVGVVEVDSDGKTIKVVECNKNDRCERRNVSVGWGYIRGYGIPNFAEKADGIPMEKPEADNNKAPGALNKQPVWMGKVTASVLNVRTWAGTNFPNIKSWPTLQKGNEVEVCDQLKNGDTVWYYVRVDGRVYGFVSANYIQKVADGPMTSPAIHVGQKVAFNGNTHYTSSYAKADGRSCRPGKAVVTAMNLSSAHQYHLVAEKGAGSTVYGWVNASDIIL